RIRVRVRTQDYGRQLAGRSDAEWGEAFATFTLEVADADDTSKFVWLDAVNGNDGNPGSFSSAKKTLASAISFAGQWHLKPGTYPTDGAAQFAPNVLVGHGDVTISYTQRNFAPAESGFYAQGFKTADGGYSTA